MPNSDAGQRTEKPTPKRKEEARRKGNVVKSREVVSVSILLTSLLVFYFYGQSFLSRLLETMEWLLSSAGEISLEEAGLVSLLVQIEKRFLTIVLPVLLAIGLAALTANFGQVGFLWAVESLTFDLSKINPIQGFKRFFSLKAVVELMKSLIKLGILGYLAYLTVRGELAGLPLLTSMPVKGILMTISSITFKILLRTTIALLIIAVLDYAFQRYEWNKGLMMTKEEIKEEMKQVEGDPKVRAKIRSMQQQMARRRMMSQVPKADVVITNPQHLAVAIRYEAKEMAAPIVVAKGAGFVAEKIKEIAREHDIPLVEDKPLARLLYKTIEIGGMIPPNLYQAMAEILAYVYRLKPNKYNLNR